MQAKIRTFDKRDVSFTLWTLFYKNHMPRGKRLNSAIICKSCSHQNFVTRLKSGTLKDYKRKKFCSWCKKATEHKAKEIKGGY